MNKLTPNNIEFFLSTLKKINRKFPSTSIQWKNVPRIYEQDREVWTNGELVCHFHFGSKWYVDEITVNPSFLVEKHEK